MSYRVTLQRYTPPASYPPDVDLWNRVRIEEAAMAAGPWTTIEPAFALAPPVVDPAAPPTYDFTSENATRASGWYRVVWIDVGGTEQPTEPVESGPMPASAPTVGEVGALLHARTKTIGGGETGTFSATTRPTAAQVEQYIRNAASLVFASTGTPPADGACPEAGNVRTAIRTLIAMRALLFIEPSLWPEQTGTDRSPYEAMREQYEAEFPRIVEAARECAQGAVEPTGPDQAGSAAWWFPEDAGGLVGWQSVW